MSARRPLHAAASAESLALVRIAVFSMWLGHVWFDTPFELASVPASLLQPIGVLEFLPDWAWALLWSRAALIGLQVSLLGFLAALIVGAGPFRVLAPVACVLLTVNQGLIRSAGFITHGELPMLYAAIVLAGFPCTDALALRPPPRTPREPAVYRAPLVAAGLALCLTYSLTAMRRIELGGLSIFLDRTIVHRVAVRGAERGGLGLEVATNAWTAGMLELSFPLVTLFELLSPLAVFQRTFRRVWLVVLVAFHVAVSELMKISFRGNLVLMTLFLTSLPDVAGASIARWRSGRGGYAPRRTANRNVSPPSSGGAT